jgi:hypothetical protein
MAVKLTRFIKNSSLVIWSLSNNLLFMSNRVVVFFLVSISTFSIYSCGECSKKIDCPGYKDDNLDAWFPYSDNQQLIFKNDLNEVDTFTLKNTFTTEPYQETSSWERSVTCSAQKLFTTVEKDSTSAAKLSLSLNALENSSSANFFLRRTSIEINGIENTASSQVSINTRPVSTQALPSITIGNRTFPNVIVAKRDTAKINGIYIFYYRKGEGLVGFSEYPSLKTWVKQ